MDPDTALAELRQAVRDWQTTVIDHDTEAQLEAAVRALTAADALDTWLTAGGFLPAAWGIDRRINFEEVHGDQSS